MATTPIYHWPSPELTDKPDGPAQIKALALAIEGTVSGLIVKPPFVQVEQSIAQSIATSTITPLNFDIENYDSSNMHSAANPSRLTATKTGYYRLTGLVSFTGNTAGIRGISWGIDGAFFGNGTAYPPNANTLGVPAPDLIVFMNAGQYAELRAYHTVGSALLTVALANSRSYASAQFLTD